jgi:hypothetical protein
LGFERRTASGGQARERAAQVGALLSERGTGLTAIEVVDIERLDDAPGKRREVRFGALLQARRGRVEQHPVVLELVARFGGRISQISVFEQEKAR